MTDAELIKEARAQFGYPKYIREFGRCIYCKRPANGILMTNRNDEIGPVCRMCGNNKIKKTKANEASHD